MSTTVTTMKQVESLQAGQWVVAEDGTKACLFDTHMGFPQRMWGTKRDGGTKGYVTSYTALDNLPLPLHLADIESGYECLDDRTNECGQCTICGKPGITESTPQYFDQQGIETMRAVALYNSRLESKKP